MKEGFNGQQLIRMPEAMLGLLDEEELLKTLCIHAIGYFPYASHHFISRPRGMEDAAGQYLLHYCVEGEGWCEIRGQRYGVKPSQFFIFPVDEPHSYGSAEGSKWTVYWVRGLPGAGNHQGGHHLAHRVPAGPLRGDVQHPGQGIQP